MTRIDRRKQMTRRRGRPIDQSMHAHVAVCGLWTLASDASQAQQGQSPAVAVSDFGPLL